MKEAFAAHGSGKLRLALALMCLVAGGFCSGQGLAIYDVKTYGATGNGSTLDSPAINAAIAAAGAAGGGVIAFPAGNYFCGSIHLTNNLTLYLSNNAVILASKTNIDLAESNPYSQYQDYGHSYFHDSLIWGENLTNLTITGSGEINGNGNLTTDTPAASQGDKALALVLCSNIMISGITITRGGHFGILANGCSNMLVSGAQILESSSRDGFNLISSSYVTVTNCTITGSDDAMVLKSDYALGRKINSQNIHIINCYILSTENNALQFGSETVGDFHDVTWANIGIGGAGKAGIGITSNDGAIIDGVTYDHISMTNCACPILLKLDNQGRAPGPPPVGRIQNISLNHVAAYHSTLFNRTNTSTIDGYIDNTGAVIPIQNIVFNDVNVSTIGNYPATAITNYPVQNDNWTPDSMGVRPSFGWYLRYASNIYFTNCQARYDNNDDRPAVVADTATNIFFEGFTADVGANNTNDDLSFLNTSGYELLACTATANAAAPGTALRPYSINSTLALIASPPFFYPDDGIYSNPQSVTLVAGSPNATIRYTIDGSTPSTTNGNIYSAPISVTSETVLRAAAFPAGLAPSAVHAAIYNFPGTTLTLPPPPPVTNFFFEAETIPFVTNGAAAVIQTDANSSGGAWMALEASSTNGPYIEYTLANVPAGTYQLDLKYKGNTERGVISHQVDGVPLNDTLDQYSAGQTYPEISLGIFTFTNAGNHTIRQTVVGKNPANTSNPWASADRFSLLLIQPPPPVWNGISPVVTGSIQINATGYPTLPCRLLLSTNLSSTNWLTIGTSTADINGTLSFIDTNFASQTPRFYRLATP